MIVVAQFLFSDLAAGEENFEVRNFHDPWNNLLSGQERVPTLVFAYHNLSGDFGYVGNSLMRHQSGGFA